MIGYPVAIDSDIAEHGNTRHIYAQDAAYWSKQYLQPLSANSRSTH